MMMPLEIPVIGPVLQDDLAIPVIGPVARA